MRLVILLAVLTMGCDEGSSPSPDAPPSPRPPSPSECGCVIEHPTGTYDDCCNSTICWFDESAGAWQLAHCDPPPDPCELCGPSELCVQRYGGICNGPTPPVECVPKTVDCPLNACSAECEAAYCPAPYQCQNRPGCGNESPLAFTCYGP